MCNENEIEELKEYIADLEEENENLAEKNRLLVLKIKELEHDTQNARNV